jgi:hypothetical protein
MLEVEPSTPPGNILLALSAFFQTMAKDKPLFMKFGCSIFFLMIWSIGILGGSRVLAIVVVDTRNVRWYK